MVYTRRTGSSAEKRRYIQGWWAGKSPIVRIIQNVKKQSVMGEEEEEGKRTDGRQI
jgi:hypothetical protein